MYTYIIMIKTPIRTGFSSLITVISTNYCKPRSHTLQDVSVAVQTLLVLVAQIQPPHEAPHRTKQLSIIIVIKADGQTVTHLNAVICLNARQIPPTYISPESLWTYPIEAAAFLELEEEE